MSSSASSSERQQDHQALRDIGLEPDPVIEAYKKDVDRTLLRRNLRLTPTERVQNLMALQRLAEEAKRARNADGPDDPDDSDDLGR